VPDLFVQQFRPFVGGDNHLTENRFFLLQVGQLLLEMSVLLFLVGHSQLQGPVQRLNQWRGCFNNFLIDVIDFGSHRLQFLAIELDQLVVLLKVFVSLAGQVLSGEEHTSTMERCPVAWVEFWCYLY
jgi:hypothetical protein